MCPTWTHRAGEEDRHMPNPREPINILLAKGRKHLTQEEIQRRMATEPTAPADDIQPPDYLSKKQREEFSALAGELQRIKIIGNVDAGERHFFRMAGVTSFSSAFSDHMFWHLVM